MGKVFLVGAGPGDPGLITQKGVLLLQKADVVLYDYLAHTALLSHCKPHTTLICVGKKKGHHSQTQTQINRLLKRYASQHEIIVRLKGGDPLLFGRGGEELLFLKKHQIPFDIIPGVSSALAVPALAGIPVTHRRIARSVAFLTGSTLDNGTLQLPRVPQADTLVILMGLTHLTELVDRLLHQKGYTPDTPIMLIQDGTLASQRTVLGSLGTILTHPDVAQLHTPTLIVVGEVAALSPDIVSGMARPLGGKRIIVPRQPDQAQEWVDTLSLLGAEVIPLPLIRTSPRLAACRRLTPIFLARFDDVILTSPYAATLFVTSILENGADVRALTGVRLIAIGPKTAQALQDNGIRADLVSPVSHQEGLVSFLEDWSMTGRRVLWPTSTLARPVLASSLSDLGARVTVLNLYHTTPTSSDFFPIKDGDIVMFTSESTVTAFYRHPSYTRQTIIACCIGPITKAAVTQFQKESVLMADAPTLAAMIATLTQ